ncbi:MAG: sigma-70 family RNA polymerase sigma factor [Blautia sp.]
MENFQQYTDEELINQLRAGRNEIENYLINKYKGLVLKKVHVMFLAGGETEDLIQEGMIGLFNALRDYNPDKNASFSTFANLCVTRQLCKAIEVSGRDKHKPLNTYISLSGEESPLLDAFDSSRQNPEAIVIDQENARLMKEKIRDCLSSLENQVLDRYLSGMTYTQIGEDMGKSPKSIDNALQRIRGKIKVISID